MPRMKFEELSQEQRDTVMEVAARRLAAIWKIGDFMPRPRFEKLPQERRASIMDAAARELAAHGYEGASLNRILEQANLSKGAAYYYFDSKDDLLAAMFVYLWDRMMPNIETETETLSKETFWAEIEGIEEQIWESTIEEPWLLSAIKVMWALPRDAKAGSPLGEAFSSMENWLSVLMRRGLELGVVRDDLPIDLLISMVLGMDESADRWVLEHSDELGEDGIRNIWQSVCGMWKKILSPD